MFSMLTQAQAAVLEAALRAVDPYAAVRAALRLDGSTLVAGTARVPIEDGGRILVLGAGKAGAPMARAVEDLLGDRIAGGCVVVKDGHSEPTRIVRLREAAHPVPNAAGLAAGAEVLDLATSAGERDLVLCLISGGGSALLEALPSTMPLEDLQATTSLLLGSGAAIREMNCVRKHLSLVKGGQLARAVFPARLVTLVLSDVVGSPLDAIASGPTVPDPTTFAEAWAVVERYGLAGRLPGSVEHHLQSALAGALPETPKPDDPAFSRTVTLIAADNGVAAEAAADEAGRRGYHAQIMTTYLQGEAREVARVLCSVALEVQHHARPLGPPACLIWGGETTVTLGDAPGMGGRNQEMALAAALALEGVDGITFVALATDGSDGPTDAAGGVVTGSTAPKARALGLDPVDALRRHDAYPLLREVGALLQTGPTRTNVNDLAVIFVESVHRS